jgi:hypothetical protein
LPPAQFLGLSALQRALQARPEDFLPPTIVSLAIDHLDLIALGAKVVVIKLRRRLLRQEGA